MNTQSDGAWSDHGRPAAARRRARRHTVLLVEDDSAMREMMACWLRKAGYEVVTVTDGHSALEALQYQLALRPDVIVMDVRMPGPSGLEVVAELRTSGWTVPVVLVSAFADDQMRRLGTHLGADAVLSKPVDVDTVMDAVEVMCCRGRSAAW